MELLRWLELIVGCALLVLMADQVRVERGR